MIYPVIQRSKRFENCHRTPTFASLAIVLVVRVEVLAREFGNEDWLAQRRIPELDALDHGRRVLAVVVHGDVVDRAALAVAHECLDLRKSVEFRGCDGCNGLEALVGEGRNVLLPARSGSSGIEVGLASFGDSGMRACKISYMQQQTAKNGAHSLKPARILEYPAVTVLCQASVLEELRTQSTGMHVKQTCGCGQANSRKGLSSSASIMTQRLWGYRTEEVDCELG